MRKVYLDKNDDKSYDVRTYSNDKNDWSKYGELNFDDDSQTWVLWTGTSFSDDESGLANNSDEATDYETDDLQEATEQLEEEIQEQE